MEDQFTSGSAQSQITQLEDRIKSAEKWMIWLTAAIAFFGLCSIGVGILQWRVMSGQLDEMKGGAADTHTLAQAATVQAAAAQNAAETSKTSARDTLVEMQKQSKSMQDAARTAGFQTTISRQNLEASNRQSK